MSSAHATFERKRQDREAMVSEAVELREQGVALRAIGEELGVSKTTVEKWLKGPATCTRCGEKLRKPVPEGLCGFCIGELELAA